jgi:hypothetical protein
MLAVVVEAFKVLLTVAKGVLVVLAVVAADK